MTTIAERKKIAKIVLTINDDTILAKIKSLLIMESKSAKEKYIEQYNKEIDAAVKRIDNGEYYTHEQVNEMLTKWQKETSTGIKKLIAILQYIAQDSAENAISVSNRVWKIINTLPEFPEMFKADDWKSKNNGNFRVFISDRIRISYQITISLIRIVSVRHTSQEPLEY